MPLILGTNSIKDTGFDVSNSVRYNDGSSDNFSKTNTSGNSDMTKFTVSLWFKKTAFESNGGGLFMIKNASSNTTDKVMIYFLDNKLNCFIGDSSGSTESNVVPNRLFRDSSAWTHLTYRYDSTQGTDSNRVRIYINGTQETSLGTSNYPDQNHAQPIDNSTQTIIGKSVYANGNAYYFDGYMCEVVLVNGQSLDPTSFGEFDSDSPTIWKPKDVSGLTFGNDGFYLDFEDSSALGNDVSGNNNDFSLTNFATTDQTTDTCTNNFCTWNPLANYADGVAFSEGNLVAMSGTNDQWDGGRATMGFSQGKWYFECLFVAGVSTQYIGVQDESAGFTGSSPHDQNGTTVFYNNSGGEIRKDGSATTNDYGTFTSSQVAGIAIDADNFTISVYKGGSAIVNAYALSTTRTGFLFPFTTNLNNGDGVKVNFGSPPYSESGGNTDANGYGNFNQSVPSGYFAINTKNLAEYG